MSDYIKREDAIERLSYHADFYQNDREFGSEEMLYKDSALNEISELPSADVRKNIHAHKVVGGGERDGATCWFECDNCGLAVDIGDVFCKHCGARFVP